MAHSVSSKAPPHFVKNSPCFQQVSSVVCEGWVLKKRRKKMQGFARRYFVLYRTGLLQYSFGPDQPVRDRISLQHAAISTAPGRKDIHIDSNTATFHIKCLSIGDFNMWMAALRKFIASGNEAKQSFSSRRSIRQASMPKSECLVENMVPLIEQLEEAILLLLQEFPAKKTPNQSKKQEKDRHKDQSRDVLNIFRKYSLHQPGTDDTSPDLPPSAQQVLRLLEQLKTQNAILLKSLQTRVTTEIPSIYHSSLPPTTEEPICGEFGQPGPSQCPRRHSIATTISDSTHEWHDAADVMSDGPEEFVVEAQSSPEQPELVSRQSSLEQLDRSGDETDLEEGQSALRDFSKYDAQTAIRRSQLPSRALGDEGSLLAMLKQNVGKDLSTITLPVTFNEPLTLLERLAEEVEYHNLLDEAVRAGNPVDRLSLVVAFAVSGYAHTRHRSGRKGFNPMLAETFEDTRMKFIAEKVRHHPVELAYHAEGDEWELSATSAGRTKFWGKSLEIVPQGNTRLRIGGDHFTWTRPSSFMRNLIVGTKYFEHCGEMIVENHTNHYRCVVEFKQNGYWGPSNVISGNIYSPTGDIVSRLEGKWDDQISQTFDSSHFRVLWRINPFPKETQDFYGFTAFGITLNEIIPNMVGKLPPTDSRYRPDVQALERGNVDAAEGAKNRMEEMQRERRKQRQDRKPRWFKQVGEEWVYTGGYWEARASGWKSESVQPLW